MGRRNFSYERSEVRYSRLTQRNAERMPIPMGDTFESSGAEQRLPLRQRESIDAALARRFRAVHDQDTKSAPDADFVAALTAADAPSTLNESFERRLHADYWRLREVEVIGWPCPCLDCKAQRTRILREKFIRASLDYASESEEPNGDE